MVPLEISPAAAKLLLHQCDAIFPSSRYLGRFFGTEIDMERVSTIVPIRLPGQGVTNE